MLSVCFKVKSGMYIKQHILHFLSNCNTSHSYQYYLHRLFCLGVAGSIPGTSANFKCGLDLGRGPIEDNW